MQAESTEPGSPENPSGSSERARSGWPVAVVATLGMSVSYIDRQTLAAIAPAVREALGFDHAHYGWLISAFSMAYLVGAPTAGIVVDRLGARKSFAIAVLVWSAIAGLHALAASFAILFFLRILLGAAEAPSFPSAAQAIRRALPTADRPFFYGLLFTGSSIGAMIAAPLAVGLEGRFGFRAAFVVTAVCGTIWLPFWLVTTRGRLREKSPEEEPALEPAPPRSIYRGPSKFVTPSAPWLRVVTSAPVLRALVAVVGSAPALMFVLNWSSQYLVEGWHLPKGDIGGWLVLPPLVFDAGAVGFGWLASRRERTEDPRARKTHVDLLLVAMVMASTLAVAPLAPSHAIAMAIFGCAAAGGGGIYVIATSDMLKRVPLERTSAAGGMTAAAQSLSHIVAAPLAGTIIDRTHGFGVVLVGLGVAVVPTTLAFVFWPGLAPEKNPG